MSIKAGTGELERSRKVYQQLGLRDFAPPEEVKKAYRELALLFHPDKQHQQQQQQQGGGSASLDSDDANRFKLINEAYQILSDENKRRRYDGSLQASAMTSLPTAFNVPSSAAPHHQHRSSSAYGRDHSSSFQDQQQDFGASFGFKNSNRSASSNAAANRSSSSAAAASGGGYFSPERATAGGASSPSTATTGAGGGGGGATYSVEQNEEFKRKEKARFADMKKRLESERQAAQEQEKQRLQKQLNEQRREEQRRRREQERLKEKLDKAIHYGSSSSSNSSPSVLAALSGTSASSGVTQQLQSTPISRSASNLPPSSSSAGGGGGGGQVFRSRSSRGAPVGGGMAAPKFATSPPNNNNSNVVGRHSYARHGTFSGSSPTMATPPSSNTTPKARSTLTAVSSHHAPPPPPSFEEQAAEQEKILREASPARSPKFSSISRGGQNNASPSSSSSSAASPELAAIALKQIEKDLDNLPLEENEEREHFLKLQERHERTLLVSQFKQEAVEIENELLFRGLYTDEEEDRWRVGNKEAVERSIFNIENQCVVHSEKLLNEASRMAHGLLAWHENVWTHLKQNLQRILLLGEREQLARTALVEDEERKESSRLHLYGQMLNRKFRISVQEERQARDLLYQNFYNGCKLIRASSGWLSQRVVVAKHESEARETLAVELAETLGRGKIEADCSLDHREICDRRTHALAAYITSLNTEIASMKHLVANHQNVVSGLEGQIKLLKTNQEDERKEHEERIDGYRDECNRLETTIARLREDLLAAEQKASDANAAADRAVFDKQELERKMENIRVVTKAECASESLRVKEVVCKEKAEVQKQLEAEKQVSDELATKYEKLKAKNAEAGEFMKELVEREEKSQKEIADLKKELESLRALRQEEQGNFFQSVHSPSPPSVAPSPTRVFEEEGEEQEGAQKQQTSGETQQQQQKQKAPQQQSLQQKHLDPTTRNNNTNSTNSNSNKGDDKKPAAKSPGVSETSSAATKTPQNSSLNNSNKNNSNNTTPQKQQQQQQQPSSSSSSSVKRGTTTSTSATPQNNNNNDASDSSSSSQPLESIEDSMAKRHSRSQQLEHRLYTAAAAASAASIAIAQRDLQNNPSASNLEQQFPNVNKPVTLPTTSETPGGASGGSRTTPTTPTTTTSANRRPPLSPTPSSKPNNNNTSTAAAAASSSSPSSSSPQSQQQQQQQQGQYTSYRELHNQAHPKPHLRPASDFEADDAAAVAQREAVASFLQKQHSAGYGLIDDPRSAPISVSPIPGKGLKDYAASANSSNNNKVIPSTSPATCGTCDMNNEAINRLANTADRLLSRNTALVEDNQVLAQAVVSLNQKRQVDASPSYVALGKNNNNKSSSSSSSSSSQTPGPAGNVHSSEKKKNTGSGKDEASP